MKLTIYSFQKHWQTVSCKDKQSGFNSVAKYFNTLLPFDTHFFIQEQILHEFLLQNKFKILNICKQGDIGSCNLKINILDVNLDTYICVQKENSFYWVN